MRIVFNCSLEVESLEKAKEIVMNVFSSPSSTTKFSVDLNSNDEVWIYLPENKLPVNGFITFKSIPNHV
jgi:hypothetical protein